jgi:hypothetical protein
MDSCEQAFDIFLETHFARHPQGGFFIDPRENPRCSVLRVICFCILPLPFKAGKSAAFSIIGKIDANLKTVLKNPGHTHKVFIYE